MEELLNNTTVQGVAGVIVLLVIVKVLIGIFKKPEVDKFSVKVRCRDCKWTGMVGKYNRTCPSCNGNNVQSAAK